jgi:hypothetical protein
MMRLLLLHQFLLTSSFYQEQEQDQTISHEQPRPGNFKDEHPPSTTNLPPHYQQLFITSARLNRHDEADFQGMLLLAPAPPRHHKFERVCDIDCTFLAFRI